MFAWRFGRVIVAAREARRIAGERESSYFVGRGSFYRQETPFLAFREIVEQHASRRRHCIYYIVCFCSSHPPSIDFFIDA